MKKLKKINMEDNLAQMFLICEGLYAATTGFLLFSVSGQHESGVYGLLSNMMSLDAWAVLLVISGIVLTLSAFQSGTSKAFSMAVAGALGGVLLLLYGVASFEIGVPHAIGVRYVIVSIFMLTISYLGARTLWIERNVANDSEE